MLQSELPALKSLFKPPFLIFRLGRHWRHQDRRAIVINCDERQIGSIRPTGRIPVFAMGGHLNSNLHRRGKHPVHRCAQGDDFPELNGVVKIQFVHGCRNADATAVLLCADRGHDIHPVHQRATEQIPQLVGIIW